MAWWSAIGRLALGAAFAGGIAGKSPPASAAPFSSLYVFGDSLTDTGNARLGALALGQASPTPAELGYFDGRFSNGPVWVDYLNQQVNGTLLAPWLAGGTNYSVGGARAVPNADLAPDLPAQIGFFAGGLALSGMTADPEALYVLNFGGNDAGDIVRGTPDAPNAAAVAPTIAGGVLALNALGARNILVAGIPNVGLQPEQNGNEAAGRALSLGLNASLGATLAGLSLAPGSRLLGFDYIALSDRIEANPAAFGFTQSLDLPCLAVSGASPACPGFLFFDAIHPTTAAHALIAGAVSAALGNTVAVPEPATLALFGFGLAALLCSRRRCTPFARCSPS